MKFFLNGPDYLYVGPTLELRKSVTQLPSNSCHRGFGPARLKQMSGQNDTLFWT